MNRKIETGTARGRVAAPPSKSYAHRLLIAAALSMRECTVSDLDFSQDVKATLEVLKGLGFRYILTRGESYTDNRVSFKKGTAPIDSAAFENNTPSINSAKFENGHTGAPAFSKSGKCDCGEPSAAILPCGESGSTLRIMIPIALALGGKFRFEGSERLFQRGLGVYEKIFEEQGIVYRKPTGKDNHIKTGKDSHIEVEGYLHGGDFKIDASISSQFVSGLLFALPLLNSDSTLELTGTVESLPYIKMTLDVLQRSGITVNETEGKFHIPGNQKYNLPDSAVEGDCSNAAFLDAFNLLGGKVEVTGLNPGSLQGDKMYKPYFQQLSKGFAHIDISNQIDLGPILFTMAAALHGAVFTGTHRLAIKESNRISDMLEELSKFGATFAVSDNEVRIDTCTLHKPSVPLNGHNDHRIVMALSVLLTRFGGLIEGSEAVGKSFPSFFDCMKQIGIKVSETN